jgi:4,5-DOPA dioxygenase extradiol
MNVLADNGYTRALRSWAAKTDKPEAILVISAHWQTRGTFVSCQPRPRQIYDFYGFPEELYQVAYACPGEPGLAQKTVACLKEDSATCRGDWGVDHAAWAVLKHMYPDAKVPVVELSLDLTRPAAEHYRMGQALRDLRRERVLILGSGNLVHNLALITWEEDAAAPVWAREMDETVKVLLERNDHPALIAYPKKGLHAKLGIPTPDHYLPMLYVLGLQAEGENVRFIHEGIQNGTVSMRGFELA